MAQGMMAPVCVACRLLPVVFARLFLLMCFMLVMLQNVSSLLIYDRPTLLDIKNITEEQLKDVQYGAQFASPLVTIPDYLRLLPCPFPGRKRRKRRGRRGGFAVTFKFLLVSESDLAIRAGFRAYAAGSGRFAVARSLEPLHAWNTPIVGNLLPKIRPPCLRRGGICLSPPVIIPGTTADHAVAADQDVFNQRQFSIQKQIFPAEKIQHKFWMLGPA